MSLLKAGTTYEINKSQKVQVIKVDNPCRTVILRKVDKNECTEGIYFTDTESYLQAFHTGGFQVNLPVNRYNDSGQGANDGCSKVAKAWLRWSTGKAFDASDESFYRA